MNLQRGGIYFTVTFEDERLEVPIVETLEFIREDVSSSGSSVALFLRRGSEERDKKLFIRTSDLESILVDQHGLVLLLESAFSGRLQTEGI